MPPDVLLLRCGDRAAGDGRASGADGYAVGPLFADINVAGTSKATGLELFARVDGFTPAETMAFGDGGNDAAMLRAAGVGVAMGNGCEEALRAADYVTASVDDDGLRRAFEHFGIIGR